MSDPLIGILGFVLALILIALGFPVGVAMATVGVGGYWLVRNWANAEFILGQVGFESFFPYTFSVIPLFVLMGVLAARAGLSRTLYDAVMSFMGHWRGGLAVTSIGACAIFGAVSGSSLATVATIGRVAIPEMERHGYANSLSAASIAAGGTLGVLIPPSILLVVYGVLTQTSIGQLFIAALVPAAIGIALYLAAIMVWVRLYPSLAPQVAKAPWRQRVRAMGQVWPVLGLFVLVIGGIYVGLFSPTEAAAVGAAGTLVLGLASGKLDRAALWGSVRETAQLTGMIFFILIGATFFNYFLQGTGLPNVLIDSLEASGFAPYQVLLLIIVFYLILGFFMDSMSMILLTIPFLGPVAGALDFNMVWFGIIVLVVAEIALITPPIGMNLFIIQGTHPGLTQWTVVRGILPFIIADVLRLAIIVGFPALVLWLPGQMMG